MLNVGVQGKLKRRQCLSLLQELEMVSEEKKTVDEVDSVKSVSISDLETPGKESHI